MKRTENLSRVLQKRSRKNEKIEFHNLTIKHNLIQDRVFTTVYQLKVLVSKLFGRECLSNVVREN